MPVEKSYWLFVKITYSMWC